MKKLKIGDTCWIQYKDSKHSYFRFHVVSKDLIHVHGTDSAAYYTDKKMPVEKEPPGKNLKKL